MTEASDARRQLEQIANDAFDLGGLALIEVIREAMVEDSWPDPMSHRELRAVLTVAELTIKSVTTAPPDAKAVTDLLDRPGVT